jgi:hypothetical protein
MENIHSIEKDIPKEIPKGTENIPSGEYYIPKFRNSYAQIELAQWPTECLLTNALLNSTFTVIYCCTLLTASLNTLQTVCACLDL